MGQNIQWLPGSFRWLSSFPSMFLLLFCLSVHLPSIPSSPCNPVSVCFPTLGSIFTAVLAQWWATHVRFNGSKFIGARVAEHGKFIICFFLMVSSNFMSLSCLHMHTTQEPNINSTCSLRYDLSTAMPLVSCLLTLFRCLLVIRLQKYTISRVVQHSHFPPAHAPKAPSRLVHSRCLVLTTQWFIGGAV